MSEHSNVVGGSTARRVIECPRSVAINAAAPAGDSTHAAEQGTKLHNAIQHILEGHLEEDDHIIAMNFDLGRADGQMGKVTGADYHEKLYACIAYFESVVEEDEEVIFEQKVTYPDIQGAFGRLDVCFPNGIIDWKFGGNLVNPYENAQGMFYLWAAIHTPETAHLFDKGPGSIYEIHIAQPVRENFDKWKVTWEELVQFDLDLKAAAILSKQDDAPAQQGDWCTFCYKKGCPLLEQSSAKVRNALATLNAPKPTDIPAALAQTPDALALMEDVECVEIWAKAVRELAEDQIEALGGGVQQGWKLIQKKGNLAWSEPDHAKLTRKIRSKLGLSAEEYLVKKCITPTQAFAKHKKKMSVKDGIPQKDVATPGGLAERPLGNIAMVRDKVKGDPLQFAARLAVQLGEDLAQLEDKSGLTQKISP